MCNVTSCLNLEILNMHRLQVSTQYNGRGSNVLAPDAIRAAGHMEDSRTPAFSTNPVRNGPSLNPTPKGNPRTSGVDISLSLNSVKGELLLSQNDSAITSLEQWEGRA